jgi:hypothetical protein
LHSTREQEKILSDTVKGIAFPSAKRFRSMVFSTYLEILIYIILFFEKVRLPEY